MAEAKQVKTTKKAAKEAELIIEAVPEKAPAKTGTRKIAKSNTIDNKEVSHGNTEKTHKVITQGSDQEVGEAKAAATTGSKSAVALAKAGKRSAKALESAEEKAAKEKRKAENSASETGEAPKSRKAIKPTRSRLERRGKKFREAAAKIQKDKVYTLDEALALATETSPAAFDATVEMHVRLNVDPRQADQNIRDTLVLPAGSGKTVRVAAFVDPEDADAAKQAGADVIGTEAITALLEKGQLNFDVLISPPKLMPALGKYARTLGPRGLMPNPKSGTVAPSVAKAITEAKAGRVEYRVDSTGIVHLGIGKVSFGKTKLSENARAVVASIKTAKPNSVKSDYIKSAHLSTTMGPGLPVTLD